MSASGEIDHWNGTAWSPSSSGTTNPLFAVWAADSSHAWAVGGYNGSNGVALEWNGSSWTPSSLPADDFGGIWGSSDTDVWVTDPTVSPQGAQHWNGTTWSFATTGAYGLGAISGRAPTDVWAIGKAKTAVTANDILHYDGKAWSVAAHFNGVDLDAIWVCAANGAVWVVGSSGAIFHD